MKGKQLGMDIGILELNPEDLKDTPDEIARDTQRKLDALEKEKESLEEVSDTQLDIEDITGTEERNAKAIEILEKERQLQEEREKEWKKEKRSKKIKRTVKLVLLIALVVILALAWLSGYRIPIPDSWVAHIQGIYNSAYNTVVGYFTGA